MSMYQHPQGSEISRGTGTTAFHSRGVGYCRNSDCEAYGKGLFLLNHSGHINCPDCRVEMLKLNEAYQTANQLPNFHAVRVFFAFELEKLEYTGMVRLEDSGLPSPANEYRLYSPLVRTLKRAEKIAEAVLSGLTRMRTSDLKLDEPIAGIESVISLDAPRADFQTSCGRLSRRFEEAERLFANK